MKELIDGTPPQQILRHDIYDLAAFPATFVHRRGVLLGDAAHAMTPDLGQGAGQAIEDAATLTLLLRGANADDLDRILQQFDRLRHSRTHGLWRQSRLTGRVAQAASPLAVRLRDTGLRAAPSPLIAGAMTKLQQWKAPLDQTQAARKSRIKRSGQKGTDIVIESGATPVSVRVRGHGPGVVLVPGGMQTAADLDRLAAFLATTFTTITIDRRGRGASSNLSSLGGMDAEAEDVLNVAKTMNAHHLFGLSSGALIALKAAQIEPNHIDSVALYEPPLATSGYHEAFDWTDDVAQMLEADQKVAALTRMIEVVGDHWAVKLAPRVLLRLVAATALRWGRGADGERLETLLPTFRQDARIVREARAMLPAVPTINARTLLMSGDRAAESLIAALNVLERELPNARRIQLQGVGHLSAANGGNPQRIASTLKAFFKNTSAP
ncbi:alpha/beta fold hydrolase [Brachybacterium fresconis]